MEALRIQLPSGETIYVWASFAGSQSEFRDITDRAAMERIGEIINGPMIVPLVEPARIVMLS